MTASSSTKSAGRKGIKVKIKVRQKRVEEVKQYLRENWGASLIIAFMALLTSAAAHLSLGNEHHANQLAEYAYYLLVAGVTLQTFSYMKYARQEEEARKTGCKNSGESTPLQKTEVSIVMPVYNGEAYIAESIKRVANHMENLGKPYEIIVVDDGSTDNTYKTALKNADNHTKIVRYSKNRGKGYAFISGALRSSGNIIVLFDADLDIPLQQINILLKTMEKTGADIVITNKWHPQSKTISTPTRRFLSLAFNALVRLLTGLKIQDTQTGAKAFKRKPLLRALKYLRVKRYAFDVELLLVAHQLGYKIAQAPSLRPIKLTSRFKIREIFKMCLELLSITYRHRILKNEIYV